MHCQSFFTEYDKEMWCQVRMDKISWTDRVRNEEVLHTVKEENRNNEG